MSQDDIKPTEILDLHAKYLQNSQIINNTIDVENLEKDSYLLKIKGKVVKFIKD